MIFVLLFSSSVVADECIKGNCVNGYGIYEFSSGTVYIGQNKDNLANGKGTVILVMASGKMTYIVGNGWMTRDMA